MVVDILKILVFHVILENHVFRASRDFMGSMGNIMILVSHVIFQHHLIKVSYDFIGRSPS